MNSYFLKVSGLCPDDEAIDSYEITVTSPSVINVERINEVVHAHLGDPIYQEDLTQEIALELAATVEIKGWHQGVLITSRAG